MLDENETLLVEHKSNIGAEAFQVAKTMCSFANTLGGWLLIGVTNGTPNARTADGWDPVAPHELTDRVREALATNKVDPIPPFAATVRDYGPSLQPVGVIRVYESVDTPHVMRNGQVFVRSVAQDKDARKVYVAGGVETQAVLLDLADRGRTGIEHARQRLDPLLTPLARWGARIETQRGAHPGWQVINACVGVRAVPVGGGARFADWAVSQRALETVKAAARRLARGDDEHPLHDVTPHASGLMAIALSTRLLEGAPQGSGSVTVAADAAGVVSAGIGFGVIEPRPDPAVRTLNGFRDEVLLPLIEAAVTVLEEAEMYGRVLLELGVGRLEDVLILDDEGGRKQLGPVPVGGELTLPVAPDRSEVRALADRWRSDVGRAAGYLTLRP